MVGGRVHDSFQNVLHFFADNEYGKAVICTGEDIVESTAIEGLKIGMADLFGFSAEEASPSEL